MYPATIYIWKRMRWLLLWWTLMIWSNQNDSIASGFTVLTTRRQRPRHYHGVSVFIPRMTETAQDRSSITVPPYVGIASVDLYTAWLDLVLNNHVVATTTIDGVNDDDDNNGTSPRVHVRYGVKLITEDDKSTNEHICREFVEQVRSDADDEKEDSPSTTGTTTPHPRIQAIQASLKAMQQRSEGGQERGGGGGGGIKYATDTSGFVAQLQLIRTLRPPAAFSSTGDGKTSSAPPPYVYEQDSFVVGPLRLPLRPRVAQLDLPSQSSTSSSSLLYTPWDVYHNVSPADPRGHFLLLPALRSNRDVASTGRDDDDILRTNCRAQILTKEDCHDMVHLVATVEPFGSLLVCYNSIGAGASQNHIHLHAWPSPPLPLQQEYPDRTGWETYPVSHTNGLYDFVDLCDGTIEVTFLEYPCCCFLLSANQSAEGITSGKDDRLTNLGNVLHKVLKSIGDAPHNVCFLNRPIHGFDDNEDDEEQDIQMEDNDNQPSSLLDVGVSVDVYVFVRSRERSVSVAPSLKMGASEMMGLFHAQSENEVHELCPVPRDASSYDDRYNAHDHSHDHHDENAQETEMHMALEEVSYEPRHDLWESIKQILVRNFGN